MRVKVKVDLLMLLAAKLLPHRFRSFSRCLSVLIMYSSFPVAAPNSQLSTLHAWRFMAIRNPAITVLITVLITTLGHLRGF